ncbi:MAG: fumarylacetoacetate hydrolase family protein [Alphaproteobacteria bacterium]|nr:fumarylacetoacetate hydrolase family protein [Alphaproteobacteria bacterium]
MPLDLEAAAKALFDARRNFTKLGMLPEAIWPVTASDGYAVQAGVVKRLLAVEDARRVGYKIGATNPTTREMLGASEAFAAVLVSDFCHASPLMIKADDYHVIILEPEIALRLGRDLPLSGAPYTPEAVANAVDAAAPAIEVVTSPFPVWNQAGIGCIIGDNGANGCWVHGAFVTNFQRLDLVDQKVTLSIDGSIEREGAGRNVDGGPMIVLAWLANFLISMGEELKAGDLVTTGSTTQVLPGKAGQDVVADFGPLGQCRLVIE